MNDPQSEAELTYRTLAAGGRPSMALGRVQRYLGLRTEALQTFTVMGEQFEQRAQAADSLEATRDGYLLEAVEAWLAAERPDRALRNAEALVSAVDRLATGPAARLAMAAVRLDLPDLAARLLERLPPPALAARLIGAWLREDRPALERLAGVAREALAGPPLGPLDPWDDSVYIEMVAWLESR